MILKDAEKYAASVCQADETCFLVNGSSCGIISAVFSATKRGDELIMARNSHKAVYYAAELRELKTHYLYPEILEDGILGSITVEMVEEAFEKYPNAKTLILSSPTYEGVVSDIASIVKAAHEKDVTVIVDSIIQHPAEIRNPYYTGAQAHNDLTAPLQLSKNRLS